MTKVYFAHPHAEKDSAIKEFLMIWLGYKYNEVVDPFLVAYLNRVLGK